MTNPLEAASALQPGAGIVAVVSDLYMPEMTGLQLLERASAIDPSIGRLLITASTGVSAGDHIRVVTKPFSLPVIRDAVRASLTRRSAS